MCETVRSVPHKEPLKAGISGPAVELAVVCLVINLVLSGAFVTWTKQLARSLTLKGWFSDVSKAHL